MRPGQNQPLMIDDGTGNSQAPRQNSQQQMPKTGNGGPGVMRVTKETTQQFTGPDGQVMTKRTQQVIEQQMDRPNPDMNNSQDTSQLYGAGAPAGSGMGYNQDSELHEEQHYQEQEKLVADKTCDYEDNN